MKSKFAKFVDCTVGAGLIFLAAAAVMRYYTTADLAVFTAVSVTACAVLLLKIRNGKKQTAERLSHAAADMFFDFMFLGENAPVTCLYNGLKAKEPETARHGNGVYLNGVAAFCAFYPQPDITAVARFAARAKRYGAHTVNVFSELPPKQTVPPLDGIRIKYVCGEDVYKLFGSLNCLPKKQFAKRKMSRKTAFGNAFGRDKIIKYTVLSVLMFGITLIGGMSIVTLVCAAVCAVFAAVSAVLALVKAVKNR